MKYFRFVFVASALALPSLVTAAILPDTIGAWKRAQPESAPPPDARVWAEYGLQASERAAYSDGARKFDIEAWRFTDSTGALAAFDHIRPSDAKPSALMGVSAENATETLVAAGNYLFVFNGYNIRPDELSHVVATVPNYAHSPLPTLPKYMPPGAIPGSERYITGPEGLARFAPGIPPGVAGFHFSAEADSAKFGRPGHETTVVIFSYPAMEMARDRFPQFEKLPGVLAKRTGPLVALAMNSPSGDEAERLLSQIRYEATVTVHERPPSSKESTGTLFLNIFLLCAVLAGFCLVSGLVVGGLRILLRRGGDSGDGDNMISLQLDRRAPKALNRAD